jgi:hypothetical protein
VDVDDARFDPAADRIAEGHTPHVGRRKGQVTAFFNPPRPGARWPRLILAFLLFLLLPLSAVRAATADPWTPFLTPWFERVGTADGLPHSVTTAVVQDSRGLIWIGTMGGLVRYDGFRMQLFDAHGQQNELPDAYVRTLLALPDGGVLVGTNAGGLARFDPVGNRFHTYPTGIGGTSDRKIYSLAADGTRGAWIATDRGLDYLDLGRNTLTHIATGDATAPRNFSVLQDRQGNLWLGNDRGLFVREHGSQRFVRPASANAVAAIVLNNQTWALHEDAEGRLWVGSAISPPCAPSPRATTAPNGSAPMATASCPTARAIRRCGTSCTTRRDPRLCPATPCAGCSPMPRATCGQPPTWAPRIPTPTRAWCARCCLRRWTRAGWPTPMCTPSWSTAGNGSGLASAAARST